MSIDMDDDDDEEDDPMAPNPSHRTTEITRFEWDTGGEAWPDHSYRLGDWEWVIKSSEGKHLLLYNCRGTSRTYGDRQELGFAMSRDIHISELAMFAVLKKLHTNYPTLTDPGEGLHPRYDQPEYKDINKVIEDMLSLFPEKKEKL